MLKTASRILYVTQLDVRTFFENDDESVLSSLEIKPASKYDSRALLYFVVTEVSTQTDIIQSFSLDARNPRVEKAFIVNEGTLLAFKVYKPNQIIYFDSTLHLNVVKRDEKDKYKLIVRYSLANMDGL